MYFSAHWAPPCRLFTQILDEDFYQKVNKDGLVAEVIFVTDDRTEAAYENNIKRGSMVKSTEENVPMPWPSQPFNTEEKRTNLKCRFGVCDMPTLVVMEPKECRLVEFYGRKDAKDGEEALKKWRAEREERYGNKEEEKKE